MRRLLLPFALFSAFAVAGCTSTGSDEVASAPAAPAALEAAPAAAAGPVPVAQLVRQIDIPYEQFTLDNGLRVVVHEDRKAPVVAISIWYNVGSKDEPKGRTGFAHLFEHLMFNGSENAPGDYFEPLREIGATDFNGTTWFDRTNYFQTVPKPALERGLFLEADRMGRLLGAVTQEKLTNQIGVVQNEKRQGDNEPYGLVEYAQLEALFPEGHPYRHSTIGSMADLDAATLEDVKNWFRSKYGPNNAVLVLAGDVSAAEARPLVEKHFGDDPARPGQQSGQGRRADPAGAQGRGDEGPGRQRPALPQLDRARHARRCLGPARRRRRACSAASPARASTTSWSARTRPRSACAPTSCPSTGSASSRSRSTSSRGSIPTLVVDAARRDRRRADRQRPDRGRGPAGGDDRRRRPHPRPRAGRRLRRQGRRPRRGRALRRRSRILQEAAARLRPGHSRDRQGGDAEMADPAGLRAARRAGRARRL